mmetsp:Transcript_32888/g.82607  ORF Transcript_32888/g.82607 Transcript_32888/m.82607 type:complete len:581 (+) Transcript_32888:1709-3451(+)
MQRLHLFLQSGARLCQLLRARHQLLLALASRLGHRLGLAIAAAQLGHLLLELVGARCHALEPFLVPGLQALLRPPLLLQHLVRQLDLLARLINGRGGGGGRRRRAALRRCELPLGLRERIRGLGEGRVQGSRVLCACLQLSTHGLFGPHGILQSRAELALAALQVGQPLLVQRHHLLAFRQQRGQPQRLGAFRRPSPALLRRGPRLAVARGVEQVLLQLVLELDLRLLQLLIALPLHLELPHRLVALVLHLVTCRNRVRQAALQVVHLLLHTAAVLLRLQRAGGGAVQPLPQRVALLHHAVALRNHAAPLIQQLLPLLIHSVKVLLQLLVVPAELLLLLSDPRQLPRRLLHLEPALLQRRFQLGQARARCALFGRERSQLLAGDHQLLLHRILVLGEHLELLLLCPDGRLQRSFLRGRPLRPRRVVALHLALQLVGRRLGCLALRLHLLSPLGLLLSSCALLLAFLACFLQLFTQLFELLAKLVLVLLHLLHLARHLVVVALHVLAALALRLQPFQQLGRRCGASFRLLQLLVQLFELLLQFIDALGTLLQRCLCHLQVGARLAGGAPGGLEVQLGHQLD